MNDESETPPSPSRAEQPKFLTDTRFDEFDLPDEIISGINDVGFSRCSPIQAQTLPITLTGRDVAGQAQTGTGKTAAFLVTIFTRLLAMPDRDPALPAALIVAPTRELARQIHDEAVLIGKHTGFRVAQIVGGVDYDKQADLLKKGVDIIACTPGRIIDYQKQGIFKTEGIKIVVIDEADRLLDMGFEKDMRYILRNLPKYDVRQSMLFSATLSYRVMELTYEYMNLPEFVSVVPEEVTVDGIEQSLFHIGKDKKLSLLLGLLAREEMHRGLIFVNTKSGVEWLTRKLNGNGWPAEGITGDLPQAKRFRLMEKFKDGKIKLLVATDVASRGIHVEDVSHVFNYDLPQDAENYVHRIGRTARAGKTGRALSLACEDYVYHLEPLEEMLDNKIPVVWPDDDWFVVDQAGPVAMPRARQRKPVKGRPKKGNGGKKAYSRRVPSIFIQRPPGYFPGTFFGFSPSPESAALEDDTPNDSKKSPKRRRRNRKKKRSHPKTENPTTPSEKSQAATE